MNWRRTIRFLMVTVPVVAALLLAVPANGGTCDDPTGECAGLPCEAADSCEADADCAEGFVCDLPTMPGDPCRPSECYCETCCGDPDWACSDDCVGECVAATTDPVPTASEWGLIQLTLLLLAAGTLVFGCAPRVKSGATAGVLEVAGVSVRPAAFARLAGLAVGLTLAGLGIATLAGLEPSRIDVQGSLLSAVLAAFVLHVWIRLGRSD